jgi:hypothetical protein
MATFILNLLFLASTASTILIHFTNCVLTSLGIAKYDSEESRLLEIFDGEASELKKYDCREENKFNHHQ